MHLYIKTKLQDYHGENHKRPTIDDSQDWDLISSSRDEGLTYLQFSRELDTGDAAQDIVIEVSQNSLHFVPFL
jgi:hypothetical protein